MRNLRSAMAHGYAKVAGKPMGITAHGTVGLQHAAMAVYNAWCDRVPVVLFAGNFLDANTRRPGVEWYHCVQDPAAMLRDFTKWDDQPVSLQHFAESVMRGYKIATTPPMGPVLITADGDLAEEAVHDEKKLRLPKLTMTIPPQGDSGAVTEAAKMLVAAQNPVILADRACRSQEGMKRIVELAEALNAPVVGYRRADEFSHEPLSLPQLGQTFAGRAGRRRAHARSRRSLGAVQHDQRPAPRISPVVQARCQDHSHLARRYADESELPGHAALHAGGSGDFRRCSGDAAGADRSGEERHQHGAARGDLRPRDQAARRSPAHEGPGALGSGARVGCQPVQHGAHLGAVVQSHQERKMVRCGFQHAMEQESLARYRVL